MSQQTYEGLAARQREVTVLGSVSSLLGWDMEAIMPRAGTDGRAEQSAVMAGLMHEKATAPEVGQMLKECAGNGFASDSIEAANIREWQRDYDRARKLPKAHVEEVSRTQTISQTEWVKARANSDFDHFAPHLTKILELTKKTAEYYGWAADGEPYDALLEGYEPGATAKQVGEIFDPLRERLSALIKETQGSTIKPDGSFHSRQVPRVEQENFVRFVADAIGFRFDEGRLDVTTHPFCSGITPGDCRITTRFQDENVMDALGSTMHESGHGIYEQNLNRAAWGTPCGEAVSLGIHESQSRGWENSVGRSRAFWEWCLPHAKTIMPKAMADQTVDSIYEAQNMVQPSFIRVEADETTYNLHIMLRFEIERAMIRGEIEVKDIPAIWNAKFKEYFGIEIDDDANGCLQDVHWSFGLMGYFPTYTLGNLFCAQFFDAAKEQLGDLEAMYREGNFSPLRTWLTENIHQHGRRYTANQLCERVTGKPLSAEPLLKYLDSKNRAIYGI